jgi:hypothetical protein
MSQQDEFEKLIESIQEKSYYTKKTYKTSYKKVAAELDDDPIHLLSQETLLDVCKQFDNPHTRHSLVNICIIVRHLYDLATLKLEAYRDLNKKSIAQRTRIKNKELDLPSYQELLDYMNSLYDDNKFAEYIINYLLIHFQVRNQDLNFEVVKLKKDTKADTNKNYIWFNRSKGTALYIRNKYKTSEIYGTKENVISDKKFIVALKRIMQYNNHGEEEGVFIPTDSAIAYHIKKATLNQIGETKYVKIILDHFKADWEKQDEIAKNRGTDIKTIREYYNINKK